MLAAIGLAQQAPGAGPYKVLKTAKVGGDGGFDYVYADVDGRRLYIPRTGSNPRITVFNLDTLEPVGEIPSTSGHGAAVDPKSGHGFASCSPIVMWDTKTLKTIKTIDVQGSPDGILFEPKYERVWVFSHRAPNATVINAVDGTVVGTVDLGGAPEQAVSDDMGHVFVDIEDKDRIAVVDAKNMTLTSYTNLAGKCGGPGGLAIDVQHDLLFAACHNPAVMAMASLYDSRISATLPIDPGTDGATFNPATMEAFSSQGNGTLTVIKENGPTSFEVEQTLQTMTGGKTLTLDTKTNHILVIAAEYTPAPAPATPPPAGAPAGRGGRGGRGQMVPGSFSILEIGR
jgi:DNA-binding beta-propeller fold protein YncE